jgi:glycosyltransferase involved in cell wall biosynthesis
MKFVIEALGLTVGGGKELALDLLSRLPHFQEHKFVLFVSEIADYRNLTASNVACIPFTGSHSIVSRFWALHRTLPHICGQHRADALLCLGNFAPNSASCPIAVFVQNAYLAYSEPVAEKRLTLREKLIVAYGRHALRALPRCARIIVQTPVMRERLVSQSRCFLDPSELAVIPNPCDCSTAADLHALRTHRDSAQPFTFLCLARYYAHKNLEVLPEAVQQLASHISQPFRCIITIAPDQHPNAAKLLRLIEKKGLGQLLVNEGPVEPDALAQVYDAADALIFPTLLETHSRTYSEAMTWGLPILTSDRDFAHHLCGNAALYFDPLDCASIAKSMAAVMANHALRQELVSNGRRILAALPDWDEVAAQFVAVLEQTAEESYQPSAVSNQRSLAGKRSVAFHTWKPWASVTERQGKGKNYPQITYNYMNAKALPKNEAKRT